MNSFLLFLTGVFSGIFAGFFLTKSFWKTNREAELNIKLKSQEKLENDLKKMGVNVGNIKLKHH